MRTRRQIRQTVTRPRPIAGGRELHLTYRVAGERPIPAIPLRPHPRGTVTARARRTCLDRWGRRSARAEADAARLARAGSSMGSFLAVISAADEAAVRALVLAAGGDLSQDTPFSAAARRVADPIRAVRRCAGRPLLMVHGRCDLPPAASATAAEWLEQRLNGT